VVDCRRDWRYDIAMHRFTKSASALLIIDVQERLAAAMSPARLERVVNRTLAAIDGAKALGLPIVLTEQYPKGLGPTLKPIAERLGDDFAPIEKLEFSALVPAVKERLSGRPTVLVTGMETHVCVFQTVRALSESGLTPYLAVDAVLSRSETDFEVGLALCRDAGAVHTTVEAALFDALGRAGGPEFKAVSAAVK
jgi:nicotinamidase-related amidase